MTKVEIIEKLTALNIPFNEDALKSELESLLPTQSKQFDCSKVGNGTLSNVTLIGDNPSNDGVKSGTQVVGELIAEPIYSEFVSKKKAKNYGKWTGQFKTDTGIQEVNTTNKMVSVGKSYNLLKVDNFNELGTNYPKYQMLKEA